MNEMFKSLILRDCQRLVKRFEDAWNSRDIEALCELYAEDAIAVQGDRTARGRDQILDLYRTKCVNSSTRFCVHITQVGVGPEAVVDQDGVLRFSIAMVARYLDTDLQVVETKADYRVSRNLRKMFDRLKIDREMALDVPE